MKDALFVLDLLRRYDRNDFSTPIKEAIAAQERVLEAMRLVEEDLTLVYMKGFSDGKDSKK